MKLPNYLRVLPVPAFFLLACGTLAAQDFAQPASQKLDDATRKQIEQKTVKLGDALAALKREGLEEHILAEIEIYHQAAYWIVKHNEFYSKDSAAWTLKALDQGLERANQVQTAAFPPWWGIYGRSVVRAYRSIVDGSLQPYAVTLPEKFNSDSGRKWRLDIVLHGRDQTLNEVKFLHNFHDKPAPKDLPGIKIDIYGRGNNAYRWAGEMDVLEAVENFKFIEDILSGAALGGKVKEVQGRGKLDPRRVVLRGFSMGGAGTWHFGLHRPDKFCVLGPGAGFTASHGYIKGLPKDLGWPQEQMLRIYDAVDYAENVFDVPVVAYAGSKDPQLQAALNIEAALKQFDQPVQFKVLVAPDLEHKFPPEWQHKAEEAYAAFVEKGRVDYPKRVHFVTYTLKYATCDWVELLGLQRHYDKAVVAAEKTEDGFKLTTKNVHALRLRVPKGNLQDMTVQIDKQEVAARPWGTKGGTHYVYLQRNAAGAWQATMPQKITVQQSRQPRKVGGLQGPIDDAFTMPFLCVRATGKPWSERTDEYTDAALKRFQTEWSKYFRGDLPIKDDVDVTSEDIADKNLILFGDPSSNTMIANVLEGLPLRWNQETFQFVGQDQKFATKSHVPVLIYPNPLHPAKYVVLNSGHTFHAEDFKGTNALLYPRLGDYAVLQLADQGPALGAPQVPVNGLFDENWRLYASK